MTTGAFDLSETGRLLPVVRAYYHPCILRLQPTLERRVVGEDTTGIEDPNIARRRWLGDVCPGYD